MTASHDATVIDAMLAEEGFGEPTGEVCPVCYAKLLGGRIVCPKCGRDVRLPAPPTILEDDLPQRTDDRKRNRRIRNIAIVSGGVVLTAGAVIGGAWFMQSSDAEVATTQLVANASPLTKVKVPVPSVVNGTWYGVQDFGDDEIEGWLTLVAEGNQLSGTFRLADLVEVPILNGSTRGNTISFELLVPYEGDIVTATTTGTVTGDSLQAKIKIELDGEFRDFEFKSERQK